MPTGFTARIADGISFRDFALGCARNFGACITLRDEPGGGEAIPEKFEPSSYHIEHAQEMIARLALLESMPPDEAAREAMTEHLRAQKERRKRLEESEALRAQYHAMLQQVVAWNPPTPEHEGLKKFMQNQIEESMEFDCCYPFSEEKEAEPLSGGEWVKRERETAARSLAYHSTEYAAEVKRVNERNQWVQDLRWSLP